MIWGAIASTRGSCPAASREDRAAVGGAGDADARVARLVEEDFGAGREPVDQLPHVRDLVVGVVEADLAGGGAEAAGGPGEHGVALAGEVLGLGADVVLGAAEAVAEEDRGAPAVSGAGEVRGVEPYPVDVEHPVRAVHGRWIVLGDGGPRAGTREDGERGGDRGPPGKSESHGVEPKRRRRGARLPTGGNRRPPQVVRSTVRVQRARYAETRETAWRTETGWRSQTAWRSGGRRRWRTCWRRSTCTTALPARTGAARFLASPGHLMLIAYAEDGVPAGFVSGIEMLHPDKGAEMCLYELSVEEPTGGAGSGGR
ncbi:hypothetical protein STANM309S_01275 [Streptomyces tanashiensis]